jgi:N-acetylglucosamine-6-sulfatase
MALTLLGSLLVACADGTKKKASASSPSIVFVLTDDQRWDSMPQLPALDHDKAWARFTNMFVDEPQCCPSRASIFTGRYPQHTKVDTLVSGKKLNDKVTVATMLHDAGYQTAFFGKYLNGFPFEAGNPVPPGWNDFEAYESSTSYYNYKVDNNGKLETYGSAPDDYSTDVWTKKTLKFLNGLKKSQPFFLELAYNAPHFDAGPPKPAPRDVGSCAAITFPLRADFNQYDKVSEPAWMTDAKPKTVNVMQAQMRATCATLHDVDRSVAQLKLALIAAGRLSNTYIVFASDNGYSFGEHRLTGKGDLYEESIRVPLLVQGPGVKPGTISRLTSNVDLTPTFLDWAGVDAPKGFLDGTSFAPELRGVTRHEPDAVLLRGCRTQRVTNGSANDETGTAKEFCGGYEENMGMNWGIRTSRYKYVEYPDGERQLFDLQHDPYELTNLADNPADRQVRDGLARQLRRMRQ